MSALHILRLKTTYNKDSNYHQEEI